MTYVCPNCGTPAEGASNCRKCGYDLDAVGWLPSEDEYESREHAERLTLERERPELFAPAEPPVLLGGRARVVLGLLIATILVDIASILVELDYRSVLDGIRSGIVPTYARAVAVDNRRSGVAIVDFILSVVTVIAFIVWFRRAYRNLPGLGRRDLRFKRGWAIGAWFVPLMNLVRPKQIANDIWRGSSGPDGVEPSERVPPHWTQRPVPALLHWWWFVYVVGGIGGNITARALFGAHTLADQISASTASVVSDAIDILAAILAILVVRALTARQEAAIAAVGNTQPAAL